MVLVDQRLVVVVAAVLLVRSEIEGAAESGAQAEKAAQAGAPEALDG
jgi:hypothetical protein